LSISNMRRFETTVLNHIQRRGDGVHGCPVLVACSGGGDSVALLSCLFALRANLKLDLVVAHADHGLRQESKDETKFVKSLAENMGLGFAGCSLDVAGHASKTGQGIEMAARELRWGWLKSEAEKIGAPWAATGHTLEDHTETVFLRLARGSGMGCFSGLPAVQAPRWSPLIECRKANLRDYLKTSKTEWLEDPTNDLGFTPRNRWRKLLADIRAEAPSIDEHLLETHRQIADALELKDGVVSSWRGSRWDIVEGGRVWLGIGWSAKDLAWALEAAFSELNLPRESSHLFGLAAWASPILSRPLKRAWVWGNWSLSPRPRGACLQLSAQDESKKPILNGVDRLRHIESEQARKPKSELERQINDTG
jgi:tRNA(Ile)-lysidine synthetase-like protein